MGKKTRTSRIDILRLLFYTVQRLWLIVLCAEIGFGVLYYYSTRMLTETYTASGTMYVNNGNPNLSEYQYTSSGDLSSAVQLIKTYLVVVKSDKVMANIVEQLAEDYPDVTAAYVSSTLSMASVSETGVVSVRSKAYDPKLAKDIVNVVMDVAPEEIIRVVGAGNIEIIDYATVPVFPDSRNGINIGLEGALAGVLFAFGLIFLFFILDQKVTSEKDLTDNYTPPILASIQRLEKNDANAKNFILSNESPMGIVENYAKLRMNLLFTLVDKESKTVTITSSVSGEGKSTISSNLAISCATAGKKVLLIDGDLRRAILKELFEINRHSKGLSDLLVGGCGFEEVVKKNIIDSLDLLPAGHFPPNPAELLGSDSMIQLLKELELIYDLIIIDMPPISVVSDPLVLSNIVAGCLFIVRQNFSDKREIRRSLESAELTGMKVLGFVLYGEKITHGSYHYRRYYRNYYHMYDYRKKPDTVMPESENASSIDNSNNIN